MPPVMSSQLEVKKELCSPVAAAAPTFCLRSSSRLLARLIPRWLWKPFRGGRTASASAIKPAPAFCPCRSPNSAAACSQSNASAGLSARGRDTATVSTPLPTSFLVYIRQMKPHWLQYPFRQRPYLTHPLSSSSLARRRQGDTRKMKARRPKAAQIYD